MTTIVEVADKAGVSIKTVSRVMNGYVHVSQKTRKRVEDAMNELDYKPSATARQMRLGESHSIGVLFGDPSSGYQSELNHSMLRACAEVGRYLVVELFDEKDRKWAQQVDSFLDRTKVKNLVLVPPMSDSIEVHKVLRERGIRFVLISPSRPVSGASSVQMDDRLAATEVTEYLINLGHKRIGHIAGHEDHIVTMLRRLGYQDAMSAAGLDAADADLILPGRFRFKQALDCAHKMLALPNRPTAIFAANDQMAVATMMAAHKMGLSVPEDLSVIGFDDTPMSQLIWPTLTTVAQPYDEIARAALKVLQGEFDDRTGAPKSIVLPHQLIERDSAGAPPS